MFLTGVLQSFVMVVLSSVFYVLIRLVSNSYDLKPLCFAIISLIMTSLVLSLAAGPGKYAVESIKSKDSWKYAITLIITYVADIFLIKYISGTEAGIFNRVTIPVSMVLAFFLFKRTPKKLDIIGMLIVVASLSILFNLQTPENLNTIILLVSIIAVFRTLMYMTSESHKQSVVANEEGYFRDKVRVVAFVSFIASMIFLVLSVSVSLIKTYYLQDVRLLGFVPNIDEFINTPSVVVAMITGALIAPVNRYLKWSATYKITSENVLCILAFTPVFTLFAEWLLSFIPAFESNLYIFEGDRGFTLAVVVLLSTIGAGLPIFYKVYKNYTDLRSEGLSLKQQIEKAQNFDRTGLEIRLGENNNQDYEIILATVNHCRSNLEKAADLLDIPLTTLEVIYKGEGDYVLNDSMSSQINRNFREKVVLSDSLTGLANRTALMSALEKLYNDNIEFGLVFIDLNKFKQINDTLGHEAGDAALIEFSNRLNSFDNGSCFAARYAGDEFCILLPYAKEKSILMFDELKQYSTGLFNFNGTDINLLASFGLAHSVDYPTADKLLGSADEVMYEDKREER